MKISIIGAGNVGGLTAMWLAQAGLGDILLVDVAEGLAVGKAFDMEDARHILKCDYNISGTKEIEAAKNSDIIIITAGFVRKPGMTREELINKNAMILKEICLNIKRIASKAIIVMVTNPLDLMTRFALEVTGFDPKKVFGMGISLDASRFANLIAKELNISPMDICACVIGSHGETMLPLPRLTNIKGVALDEFLDGKKIESLVRRTLQRGLEIVTLLGSGSAYFAPSAAIAEIVKAIVKDEKRTLGVCAYLNGEYAVKDVCIGVPCRIGRDGIEQIIELDLNKEEKEAFYKSVAKLKEQYAKIDIQ